MTLSDPARFHCFDWLRGIAVLVMVQTHTMGFLTAIDRASPLARFIDRVDGLVAPAFLFTAGFSLGLVQLRRPTAATRLLSLRRIAEVLAVASLINVIWFPVFRAPSWLLRLDILHCVGLSLLMTLALVSALSQRPTLALLGCLSASLVLFGISPLLETPPAPWGRLLSHRSDSLFPLLPWAAYVFLGATAGVVAARWPSLLGRWLLSLFALSAVAWSLYGSLARAYPPHDYWVTNPANAGQRLTCVLGLALALWWWERHQPQPSLSLRLFTFLGTASLAAYFWHEMLLFLGPTSLERLVKPVTLLQYPLVVLTAWAGTFGLVWLQRRVMRETTHLK
jgi:uncharacterized membrane protein